MSVWYVWILACRVSLKGSTPGISHRGWNCWAGWVPRLKGLPPCGQCPAPLFSPFNSPHSLPGLAQGQTEERGGGGGGSSCWGFPELPGGGGSHPCPPPFAPPLCSSPPSFSALLLGSPPLSSSPHPHPPRRAGRQGGEWSCPSSVQGFAGAR